jgi:hypothetical protein
MLIGGWIGESLKVSEIALLCNTISKDTASSS